ncbi:MAG: ThuA domain-containing protein [Balneolaceae bacterium]
MIHTFGTLRQLSGMILASLFMATGLSGCGGERSPEDSPHILFIAGAPSHGFGNHEHLGGSTLLARTLERSDADITTQVVSGWPRDASLLEEADAIIIYSNGGTQHPALDHLDELESVLEDGTGFVTLHYAVEVPTGDAGEVFLKGNGGYFETHWSVNPIWTADIEQLPTHPIRNGVDPFTLHDEWYYHMRFSDDPIQPILTALPPPETLEREDGPHSNNPHVREAVLERKEPQHLAWAFERPSGGRGFGFTGGHYHWNWGVDHVQRLVANAILWSAGVPVPEKGVSVEPMNVLELAALTDDPIPEDWNWREIQQQLDAANGRVTDLDVIDSR